MASKKGPSNKLLMFVSTYWDRMVTILENMFEKCQKALFAIFDVLQYGPFNKINVFFV